MNKKIIITIGVIIGLAIIAGGFWHVQWYIQDNNQKVINNEQEKVEVVKNDENENKQDIENQEKDNQNNQEKVEELKVEDIDTSNWKEYCNQEYGFCVKYPSKSPVFVQKFSDSLSQDNEYIDVPTKIIFKGISIDNSFSVAFGSGVSNQSVIFGVAVFPKKNDAYYKLKFPQFKDDDLVYEVSNYAIGDVQGKKVIVRVKDRDDYYHSANVFIEKNDNIFMFWNGTNGYGEPLMFSAYQSMFIKSFKFIN